MKKWNEMNTKQKSAMIAIPVLVIVIIILAFLLMGGNETANTEVATNDTEITTTPNDTLDVETIEKDETEEVESTEVLDTEVVEPTEEPTSTEEVLEPTEEVASTENTDNSSNEESGNRPADWDSWTEDEKYMYNLDQWTKKATWTASNGCVIKINDAFADLVNAGDIGAGGGNAIYTDGTEDLRPNSDYMNAVNEYVYGDDGFTNADGSSGTDRWNSQVVDVSKLPEIPVATSKKTSFSETEEFKAFRDAFNPLYGFQVTGSYGDKATSGIQIYNGGSGIGLTSPTNIYIFEINAQGDGSFKCIIRSNLSSLQWSAFRAALRLVSPDAESLYNEIFTQCYQDNPTFPEYDMWVTIGDSEALVVDGHGNGQAEFWFK